MNKDHMESNMTSSESRMEPADPSQPDTPFGDAEAVLSALAESPDPVPPVEDSDALAAAQAVRQAVADYHAEQDRLKGQFVAELKAIMQRHRMSVTGLAESLGVSRSTA